MITLKHLEIHNYFNGDGDGYIRNATEIEKAFMTYQHWSLIQDFIQDIHLVMNGLASKSFSDNLESRLKAECENENTILQLKSLAGK